MAVKYLPTSIFLNVNELNSQFKRQSIWVDKKTRPLYILPTRDSPSEVRTHKLKMKRCKKTFHDNGTPKKLGATLIPETLDF